MNVLNVLNQLRSERSYLLRDLEPPQPAMVFNIETTSVCNLKCVMCPHPEMTRDKVLMPFDLFERIVEQIGRHNGRIWLHNLGEPLAHPEFDRMIALLQERGIPTGISTNATLLDERRGRRLIESGLDRVVLCLDGASAETYEKLRVGASWSKVTGNIRSFLELKRRLGVQRPRTVLQLIYMRETEEEVDAFRRTWEPLADEVLIKRFTTWANHSEEISGLADAKHRYEPLNSLGGVRHPCQYLWRNVVVTVTGEVIPCCADFDATMVVGDLREETLEEIWRGDRYRELRRQHLAGDYRGACSDCVEWVGSAASRAPVLSGRIAARALRRSERP